MRIPSPPTDVGRICPAVYAVKYARTSQRSRSRIPRAASSFCQRQAIGQTVTTMIATAPKK